MASQTLTLPKVDPTGIPLDQISDYYTSFGSLVDPIYPLPSTPLFSTFASSTTDLSTSSGSDGLSNSPSPDSPISPDDMAWASAGEPLILGGYRLNSEGLGIKTPEHGNMQTSTFIPRSRLHSSRSARPKRKGGLQRKKKSEKKREQTSPSTSSPSSSPSTPPTFLELSTDELAAPMHPGQLRELLQDAVLKKQRLKRKAELARLSRKAKQIRMNELERQVDMLKEENRKLLAQNQLLLLTKGVEQVPTSKKAHIKVEEWTVEEVSQWLEDMKLDDLVEKFKKERVDGDVLLSLNEEVLAELGITSKVHQSRVLPKVNRLRQGN